MRHTELELGSDLFDQPPIEGLPRKKLLILAPPRSGSYMLCRLMLKAGLGIPHEYFNEIHMRIIGRRFGVPDVDDVERMRANPTTLLRYLHALFARRTRDGIFAAKIQHKQFRLFLSGPVGDALFEDATLIYLTRQDLLAQAVSQHFAEVTGRWSFETTRLTRPDRAADIFDAAAIERILAQLQAEHVQWESLFALRRMIPFRTTFEQLRDGPGEVLARIGAACGVAPDRLDLDDGDEGSYLPDPGYPPKAEVAAYFRAARAPVTSRFSTTCPGWTPSASAAHHTGANDLHP